MSAGISTKSTPLSHPLVEKHEVLRQHSTSSPKMQKAILKSLKSLDDAWTNVEKDLKNLCVDDSIDSESIDRIKQATSALLAEKQSVKDLISTATRIKKILNQIHSDLSTPAPKDKAAKHLSYLKNLSKSAKLDEALIFRLQTDQDRLGPKETEAALRWLQRARITLLKGQGHVQLPPHEFVGLMKRIGDLEDRLQKTKDSADFTELLFTLPEINLDHVLMKPVGAEERGTSGSYFVYDTAPDIENPDAKIVAVFKPNNEDSGLKPAVPVGDALMRQCAAYLIDKMNGGKAGVALTLRAASSDSMGAIQVFKNNGGPLEALTSSEQFAIPADQLHILTIHRSRLNDLDAHLSNVLWQLNENGEVQLISIDHDYSLPVFDNKELLLDRNNFLRLKWAAFPQMDIPFSAETKAYIRSLDVEKEAVLLREMGFSIAAINHFKATSWFFQEAAANSSLLPGEIVDYLLSENYSEKEKYPLIREMIDIQDRLAKQFSDPTGADWEAYSHEFETQMKAFIQATVKAEELEIQRYGSFRRTTR